MPLSIDGPKGRVRLSDPELYVDNEARGRSGHVSHALVEYSPGKILAFNSNCSALRLDGHSAFGWIEYRRSVDSGATWSGIQNLPFGREAFLDGLYTISVEKAVSPAEGEIIALCTRNTPYEEVCCEPWLTPRFVRSLDGGVTWSPAESLTPYEGRIYDAIVVDGSTYVLQFCNDGSNQFVGSLPDHLYRLSVMRPGDPGFAELSTLPINGFGRGYGSLLFRPDGSLLSYAYNINDERHLDYALSLDVGRTWSSVGSCLVAKGIRNPQAAYIDGTYLLHGRAASGRGFVLYTSPDGLEWDEGFILEPDKERCYYSNNLAVSGADGKSRLLVQYSDAYRGACVNVMHMWIDVDS